MDQAERKDTAQHALVYVGIAGMPRLSGYEAARRIRQTDERVVRVALTGWGQEEDRQRSNSGKGESVWLGFSVPGAARLRRADARPRGRVPRRAAAHIIAPQSVKIAAVAQPAG